MVTYLAGTDGVRTSTRLGEYLDDEVAEGDTVHALYALGANPSQEDIDRGEEALAVFTDRFGREAAVELHHPIRSTPPSRELLITANEVDADKIVVGLRQHGVTERIVFGSTAQEVLKNTTRPVVAVPLATG
ncbi:MULTISPECIES: universal stress protein [Halorussus]|uniref:universal stress protein n=1 Tax=Halorussus TaxID=1070314 RepID=UPI00209E9C85|nr:universal stress protein [Halorussus vallis]USZ76206.1 universal stress protein [Halorussus vallis]